MSIEAMKLALDALESRCGTNADERLPGGAIPALRAALSQQPATPEPVASRNPFASRCYTMSESHLSGHRLIVGFEKLGDAQDAHEWVARQARGDFTHPVPSVFLVRDIASLLGASVPDVCNALAELGYEPRRSTNAAISPDEALAVADHLRPVPSVSDEEPLPDLMLALHHEAIGWNAHRAAMLAAKNPSA